MKNKKRVLWGLFFAAIFLLSSCNKYVVCPAYADANKATTEKKS